MNKNGWSGSDAVSGILVPVGDLSLLLPNSAVAEVTAYRRPNKTKSEAAWLLGTLDWRERLVPAISITAAQEGQAREELGRRACFVVCYSPRGNEDLPYVAVFASAAPRLASFRATDMKPAAVDDSNPFVLHSLSYGDQPAWIPDMDAVERAVLEVL